jgi:adenylosuccinate lyase
MKSIFEEENRIQKMFDVEAALAWARGEVGDIPKADAEKIVSVCLLRSVELSRIKEIEREIKHDVASLVRALAEACGPSGAYVHLGATSYDIVDTATALQLKDALALIDMRLSEMERVLMEKAAKYRDTVMVGRTHGQHALPTTLGFKFTVWLREISRHIERLGQCKKRVIVGKMSGAVGTQASLGENAKRIQEVVMRRLAIEVADISTQIVQRDRHAELICLLAGIAASIENFATEIRELQRPEIAELSEQFEGAKQVGSSTMPHKRNPETCEMICGLSRIVRSLVNPALENVTTWHERDLTQSSAERFIFPEAFILTDHILFRMTGVIDGLKVDQQKMIQNLDLTEGRLMSEAVMMALSRKGMDRQEAHGLLRKLTLESESEKRRFKEVLKENKIVSKKLNAKDIDKALSPMNYLGTAPVQVDSMIKKTMNERSIRH